MSRRPESLSFLVPFLVPLLVALLLAATDVDAGIINVPADAPTIQAGIGMAANGDEVVVANGTYSGFGNRNINTNGKAITVRSASGNPALCIIDCQGSGRGFFLAGGETLTTIIQGFTIRDALAFLQRGAGIRLQGAGPLISNCVIESGSAFEGGGVSCEAGGNSPTLVDCIIRNNTSNGDGAGVFADQSDPTMINCLFVNNSATGSGGAVRMNFSGTVTLINCTLTDNMAAAVGGVSVGGGGAAAVVTNCILWGNTPIQLTPGPTTATYCDVQGGFAGAGNINVDPLFVDPVGGDFRLSLLSNCVDAANNNAVPGGITRDLGGEPRFVDDPDQGDTGIGTPPIVDMGAYERQDLGLGACCMRGSCQENTTIGECASLLGSWLGAGTVCAECPVPGACCFVDGVCLTVLVEDCLLAGGDYQGNGVPCREVECVEIGSVLVENKISDTQGNFTGILDNRDELGFSSTSLGDLDGDGVIDIAAGAPNDDDGGSNRGAVWIMFLNPDGTVRAHQKISDLDGGFTGIIDDTDEFGYSVTSLGDLDGDGVVDLAVGAYRDDDGGFNRGAVWILFLNTDGTVKTHQKISDTAGGFAGVLDDFDEFGSSVAALGDDDGDGILDIVVGAQQDDDGGSDRGAVWILRLDSSGLVVSHQKISDTAGGFGGTVVDGDGIGSSVAAVGDINDDGIGDLAIGAPEADDGGGSRGVVWILFLNADGTVAAHQRISDTAGAFFGVLDNGDGFGVALAGLGDLNGDGIGDLAVGAASDDDMANPGDPSGYGAVWILYLRENGTVKTHSKISATSGGFTGPLDGSDRFGRSVMLLGDFDGDGKKDLGVGAHQDDDGGMFRGAMWLLQLENVPSGIGFDQPQEFVSDGEAIIHDTGDLDDDGDTDVVVVIPALLINNPGRVQVFLNQGVNVFGDWLGLVPLTSFAAGRDPRGITVGQFDADSSLDIAVTNQLDDDFHVYINDASGNGTFGPPISFPTDQGPTAIVSAVFFTGADPDAGPGGGGEPADIAVANTQDGTVQIFENDGFADFAEAVQIITDGPCSMEPEDLDNDKDTDLVIGRCTDASIDVWYNGGLGAGIVNIPVGSDPVDLAVGDLDLNGFIDVVSANTGGTLSVALNFGPGDFDAAFEVLVGADPRAVEVADFDLDLDLDLAVASTAPGVGPSVQVLENLVDVDDELSFAPPVNFEVDDRPNYLVVADLDEDASGDIILVNPDEGASGGSVTVLLFSPPGAECPSDIDGDGTTGFLDLLALLGAWGLCPDPPALCPEDIDGDGDVDFQDLLLLLAQWGGCD